jgi:hypothetical protein
MGVDENRAAENSIGHWVQRPRGEGGDGEWDQSSR